MADQDALGREYVLHEEIGRGALAVVRRAVRRSGGPPLAAKLLRPELAGDRRVRELFLREEAALRDLDHPNIVGLRDLVVEGGAVALVMDFVDGPDLRRHLAQHDGRLGAAETAAIVAQVAGAVAAAHAQGVVHLDLKPENLLLVRGTDPPVTRVTDFGVAVLLLDADRGVAGGTPGYTAPEIWQGAPPTAAADVYSLGVLLVEMITGDSQGDPEALPAELAGPARSCLLPDPRQRPTARRLASYLRSLADAGALSAQPAGGFPRAPQPLGGATASGPAAAGPESAAAAQGPSPLSRQTTLRGAGAAAGAAAAGGGGGAPAANGAAAAASRAGAATGGAWAGAFPSSASTPDPVDAWAGQFGTAPTDPEIRETRLRPGVTPPSVPPEAPQPPAGPPRWRRGPLVTLAVLAAVAATLIGVNIASADDRDPRRDAVVGVTSLPAATATAGQGATLPPTDPVATNSPTSAPALIRVTLAGFVEDDAGTLAISIRDGIAIAYVCDGDRVEAWLRGTAENGVLKLSGKGSKIDGTFDARGAEGDITLLGEKHGFTLKVAKKPSGLYRASAEVRGAKVEGSWIVLPDGRQVGVLTDGDEVGPAPQLDVTGRTTTVDGTTVGATAIDVDSGEGF
ncbi:serine/threonine-protein kinase [Actinoplanes awajinensis]|uniref:non-specific serine/threonine protein kinase n=1 Tax=Actinoplanes awajinensis subsp. mycoplanecinus TaxID=135947 RepID=A0A0X3UZB3_9ACTN|nr:serine/threonine-protein kinase [Actinoplanes awajinensis]KUL37855.1 serine/threonine protein kinase [Actinoplanes awajinensis subsp. mycoplanecinus]